MKHIACFFQIYDHMPPSKPMTAYYDLSFFLIYCLWLHNMKNIKAKHWTFRACKSVWPIRTEHRWQETFSRVGTYRFPLVWHTKRSTHTNICIHLYRLLHDIDHNTNAKKFQEYVYSISLTITSNLFTSLLRWAGLWWSPDCFCLVVCIDTSSWLQMSSQTSILVWKNKRASCTSSATCANSKHELIYLIYLLVVVWSSAFYPSVKKEPWDFPTQIH